MLQSRKIKSRLIGQSIYYFSVLLRKTLNIHIALPTNYDPNAHYLCCFWHGKQFLLILELVRIHSSSVGALVSPSRDGDLLTACLNKLGYVVVRGSSRARNVSGTKKLIQVISQGVSMGWGVDGPIGPIEKVKPGITYLAQKLGLPILPIGAGLSDKWILKKTWDQFEIPKPFSKGMVCVGEPMWVAPDADLARANVELEHRLKAIQAEAEQKVFQA